MTTNIQVAVARIDLFLTTYGDMLIGIFAVAIVIIIALIAAGWQER